jgi:enterobactin synthetase component D
MTRAGPTTDSGIWIEEPLFLGGHVRGCATNDLRDPVGGTTRAREFAAGRRCAARALREAGAPRTEVGVGLERRPIWPSGFVGSITHTATLAWAAVAAAAHVRSLGIDSEPIFDDAALRDAVPLVLDDEERRLVRGDDGPERATLIFSAKESLFKCLNPCVGVFFEFGDAKLEWIAYDDRNRGTFALRLLRDLTLEFPRGRQLLGLHAIARGHVHTAVQVLS